MQPEIREVSLQLAERGLEAWRFLFVVLSSVLLTLPVFFIIFFIKSLEANSKYNMFFSILAVSGIPASIFLLISLVTCRPRTITFATFIFLLLVVLLLLFPFREYFLMAYNKALTPLDFLLAVVLITVGISYLASEVIRSVWVFTKALGSKVNSRLLRANSSINEFVSGIFGIPASTRWIKWGPKKTGLYCLFVLSQMAFAVLTFRLLRESLTLPLYYKNYNLHVACFPLFFPDLSKTPGWIPVPVGDEWTFSQGQCLEAFAAFIFVPLSSYAFLFLLTVALRSGARKSSRISLQAVRENDHRAPILFLRSFFDDQVRLRPPKRSVLRRLMLCGEPRPFLDHILLEEGIRIGPVVAIGAPGKRPPFGIPRTYASDSSWQTVIAELGNEAKAIAIVVDETEGVGWELEHIARHELEFKTLFLLPPKFTSPQVAAKMLARFLTLSGRDSTSPTQGEGFSSRCGRPCIGWTVLPNGQVEVITSATASETAYRVAIRYFLEVNLDPKGAVKDDAKLRDALEPSEDAFSLLRRARPKTWLKPVAFGFAGLLIGVEVGVVFLYWTRVDPTRFLCDDLGEVIADGRATRFNSLAGRDLDDGVWTARIQLFLWQDCRIFEISHEGATENERLYSCTLGPRSKSAAEIRAKSEYEATYVKPCLGPEWTEQRSTRVVEYVRGQEDPVVGLREVYSQERRDWALQLFVRAPAKGAPQN